MIRIRLLEHRELPVIFLTAKGKTPDKVKGLRGGAEDYMTKPFDILELLARVENVLRRHNKLEQEMNVCGLHVNIPARSVTRDGKEIALTMKEFDLLLLFLRNPDVALYREMIYEQVWGSSLFWKNDQTLTKTFPGNTGILRRKL